MPLQFFHGDGNDLILLRKLLLQLAQRIPRNLQRTDASPLWIAKDFFVDEIVQVLSRQSHAHNFTAVDIDQRNLRHARACIRGKFQRALPGGRGLLLIFTRQRSDHRELVIEKHAVDRH